MSYAQGCWYSRAENAEVDLEGRLTVANGTLASQRAQLLSLRRIFPSQNDTRNLRHQFSIPPYISYLIKMFALFLFQDGLLDKLDDSKPESPLNQEDEVIRPILCDRNKPTLTLSSDS